jgi:hypothetical protein
LHIDYSLFRFHPPLFLRYFFPSARRFIIGRYMKKLVFILFIFNSYAVFAQTGSGKDSTAFLDSIFNEMDEILDAMIPKRNYFSASVGAGTGFFNFKNLTTETFDREKKLMFSPSVSFFHKTGFGITGTGYAINDDKLNFYQWSVSPSYDYIKRGKWSTGIAYTHYFTKDDLSFYTTPIHNEVSAYFTYKKWIVQPAASVAYGWGRRTEYQQMKVDILKMRKKREPRLVTIRNEESVNDLSVLLSVRHDFNFSRVFHSRDLLILTPVAALSSGTQSFGLNTTFSSRYKQENNFLPGNQYIEDQSAFDTQSMSAIFRADYSISKFFFQSQLLLDYYLHNAPDRFNNAFAVIIGVNF